MNNNDAIISDELLANERMNLNIIQNEVYVLFGTVNDFI